MACSLLPVHAPLSSRPAPRTLPVIPRGPKVLRHRPPPPPLPPLRALPGIAAGAASGIRDALADAFLASPPTWRSAAVSNLAVFVAGSPVLLSGLSASGFAAAYLLGTLTWRAFGPPGFLLVVAYFVVGTAVTKLKIKQKEARGVAEKRGGRRGPGSVIGSSAAGCVCALLSIYHVGCTAFSELWRLGFVASFCTKLSDTVSSEIGKAFGRTTYLVTTFKVVPRGTEGAVSIEGTLAGILASVFLASVGYLLGQVGVSQVAVCLVASQIANYGESYIGATLQDKEGFEWLNNDIVNVLNISIGAILAVLMQKLLPLLAIVCEETRTQPAGVANATYWVLLSVVPVPLPRRETLSSHSVPLPFLNPDCLDPAEMGLRSCC
ncbi:putative conserved membrane protein-like [Panicum miliaceum]|uniref:Conserved membrane protein-like n=1 Tax=Panicum miliaceum TaxID=4540 RepID=A0A3L6SP33_PANMI|nr:putative conserved membrane protein-like [Panicum miliaceum]